jgi:antitoxin component of RelBE/YafQ-DinJ toxin-antitoxin module
MKKTELLQIRVSPQLKEALKKMADKEGMTMSGLIENMLGELVNDTNLLDNLDKKINELQKITLNISGRLDNLTKEFSK